MLLSVRKVIAVLTVCAAVLAAAVLLHHRVRRRLLDNLS